MKTAKAIFTVGGSQQLEAETRRSEILHLLAKTPHPLTGGELAQCFSVSRQVIVQDIAILRAAGHDILATPQGYVVHKSMDNTGFRQIFACKHNTLPDLERELIIMVDSGGTVIDVVVEHPLYGELKGLLMLRCRRDVAQFVEKLQSSNAKPLSYLTGGVHLHTVEAPDRATLDHIGEELKKAGLLAC